MRLRWQVREGRASAWLYAKGFIYWKELRSGVPYRVALREAMKHIRERIEAHTA